MFLVVSEVLRWASEAYGGGGSQKSSRGSPGNFKGYQEVPGGPSAFQNGLWDVSECSMRIGGIGRFHGRFREPQEVLWGLRNA